MKYYTQHTFRDPNIVGVTTRFYETYFDPVAVYITYHWSRHIFYDPNSMGSNAWPGDGTDAISSGKPGNGGQGGGVAAHKRLSVSP